MRIKEVEALRQRPLPAAINKELDRLELTQVGAAELLRINPRTMRRYLQEPGTRGSLTMPFVSFALLMTIQP